MSLYRSSLPTGYVKSYGTIYYSEDHYCSIISNYIYLRVNSWFINTHNIPEEEFIVQKVNKLLKYKLIDTKLANIVLEMYNIAKSMHTDNVDIYFEYSVEFKEVINDYQHCQTLVNSYNETICKNHTYSYKKFTGIIVKDIGIVIKYPEVQLSNSLNKSYKIRDLLVYIPVNVDKVDEELKYVFMGLRGKRMTLDNIEYSSNRFQHSHLNRIKSLSNNIHGFSNFCLGDSDISNINCLLSVEFSSNLFELLLHQIGQYITWESLEGGPHRKIKELSPRKGIEYILDYTLETIYNIFKNSVHTKGEQPDINWTICNNSYKILDDSKFEDFLRTHLLDTYPHHFVYKDSEEYFTIQNLSNYPTGVDNQYITVFRGVETPLSIVIHEETISFDTTLYLHPKIKNEIKNKLEDEINKAKYRGSVIKRLSESNLNQVHTR